MSKPSAPAADDAGRAAYYHLKAYVNRWQDEACELEGLLNGAEIIQDDESGSNALRCVLTVARAKAQSIFEALDSVNLPKIDPLSVKEGAEL